MAQQSQMEGMVMKLKRNKTELTGILGIEKINEIIEIYERCCKDVTRWREYRHIYQQASTLEIITPYTNRL